MSQRTLSIVGGVAIALSSLLAVGACTVEALDTVPAYPGAQAGAGYRTSQGTTLLLKQIYYSGDGYSQVLEFYEQYVAETPGWEGSPGGGLTIWKRNMKIASMMASASPIDPEQPGKAVVITDEGTRTVIRAFSSHPGAAPAAAGP